MTTAVINKGNSSFKDIVFIYPSVPVSELKPIPRPVNTRFKFTDRVSDFPVVNSTDISLNLTRKESLVSQIRALRRERFWFLWGLKAPQKCVVDAAIRVINYCPSELLLDGYSAENYGNGTIAFMKRTANCMITINVGKSSLSYAKLRITDHKVIDFGRCEIEGKSVAKLFQRL